MREELAEVHVEKGGKMRKHKKIIIKLTSNQKKQFEEAEKILERQAQRGETGAVMMQPANDGETIEGVILDKKTTRAIIRVMVKHGYLSKEKVKADRERIRQFLKREQEKKAEKRMFRDGTVRDVHNHK